MTKNKQKQINIEFRKESSINLKGELVERMEERLGFIIIIDDVENILNYIRHDTIEQALDELSNIDFHEIRNDIRSMGSLADYELYINGRFVEWDEWNFFKNSIDILLNW